MVYIKKKQIFYINYILIIIIFERQSSIFKNNVSKKDLKIILFLSICKFSCIIML